MSCDNPRHAPCEDCGGEIIVGEYDPIRLPRRDEEGFPMVTGDGELLYVDLPLPRHVAPGTHSRLLPANGGTWEPYS